MEACLPTTGRAAAFYSGSHGVVVFAGAVCRGWYVLKYVWKLSAVLCYACAALWHCLVRWMALQAFSVMIHSTYVSPSRPNDVSTLN